MFYKESKNFLTEDNKKFIENIILGKDFPYYIIPETTTEGGDNCLFLRHCLLVHPEYRINKEHINSNFYLKTLEIVHSFFKKLKIKHKEILRMSINLTFNNGHKKCPIHQDHPYPHKQLIIYLNDADPISKTILLKDNGKILKKITPEKYKGVCFDNLSHYHFYPIKGVRIILITTFR